MCIGELVHAILSTHYMQAAAVWLGSSYSYSWYGLWNLLMQSNRMNLKNFSLSIFVILMQKYLEPRGKWFFSKVVQIINVNEKNSPFKKKKNQKVICIYRFSPFFSNKEKLLWPFCASFDVYPITLAIYSNILFLTILFTTFRGTYLLRQFFKQLNSLFLSNQN